VYQRIVNQEYQSHFRYLLICNTKKINQNSVISKFKTNSRTLNFLNKSSLINRAEKILRFFVVENTLEILKTARVSVEDQQRSSRSNQITRMFQIDLFDIIFETIQKNLLTI